MMFTIDSGMIERAVLDHVPQQFKLAVEEAVLAGESYLIAIPAMHGPVANELGAGAVHLMLLLYQESKQSMPLEAFIPAGTILIAKAAQLINDTKIAPITDDDFSEAVSMFVTVTYSKFDPDFEVMLQQTVH